MDSQNEVTVTSNIYINMIEKQFLHLIMKRKAFQFHRLHINKKQLQEPYPALVELTPFPTFGSIDEITHSWNTQNVNYIRLLYCIVTNIGNNNNNCYINQNKKETGINQPGPKRTKLSRSLFQTKIISLFIINPYQWLDISICVYEHICSFDL